MSGTPSLRCSLPSRPLLEAQRPGCRAPGRAQGDGSTSNRPERTCDFHGRDRRRDTCPSPSRLHPQRVPRPQGLKRWTGCKGQPRRALATTLFP